MIRINNAREYKKYVILALIILVVYAVFLIIKPILIPILSGAVLAYIFYPVYKMIHKKTKIKTLSAAIMSIIIILLLVIPGFFLLNVISRETYLSYALIKQKVKGGIVKECAKQDSLVCNIINEFQEYTSDPKFQFYLEQGLGKLTSSFAEAITKFIFSIPKRILEIFIAFFVMYYLFKDGDNIIPKVQNLLPVDKKHQQIIIKQSKLITYGVIYGAILVALIQGVLGTMGFYIFGISTPIVWGILMAFCALVPVIGTAIIWLPAAIVLMINGYIGGESILIWKSIGLIIYGILIIASVDNLIKPKIISAKTRIHPIIILIGVIGGIALLGFIGALIGPLLLSLSITIAKIYQKDGIR